MKFLNKLLLCAVIMAFTNFNAQGQLVISEIMYNPPETNTDSLEYLEITNVSESAINLMGYFMQDGVEYTFGDVEIMANESIVICKNDTALQEILGITCFEWTGGALSNGGENLAIADADSMIIDQVDYDDNAPWPTLADGDGFAMELCDLNLDNNDGLNWKLSNVGTGAIVEGVEIFGSPGIANNVSCITQASEGEVVISEILYNDPSAEDNLEFIELVNVGVDVFNLQDWTLSGAVDFTFPEFNLEPNELVIIARNGQVFESVFGVTPLTWTTGELGNSGAEINLTNAAGVMIDQVAYGVELPWTDQANGSGRSIELCDLAGDNNLAESWQASSELNSFADGDSEIVASPGRVGSCIFDISDINQNDENGLNIFRGNNVRLRGVVYGENLRPDGLQFTLIDINNEGIGVTSANNFGYELNETDEVIIEGEVEQFNGFTQIALDTVVLQSQNSLLVSPTNVTVLDESTESQLVRVADVMLVDQSEWTQSGAGFNARLTNGTDTFTMRIDRDVDIFDMGPPQGTFSVTGLGGQFDTSSPFDEGYQILPRYALDIEPYDPLEVIIPTYSIGQVNKENSEGVADSLEVRCILNGTVYGVDLRGTGLAFTIIDDSGEGIVVFNVAEEFDYVVREGDIVNVTGFIDQFNGLTEIIAEGIELLSFENPLIDPVVVTQLNEESESSLVTMNNLVFADPSEWLGDGSSFNVTMVDENGIEHTMRIDNDVELANMAIPTAPFNVTGLGGQFDPSAPFDEGYQLFPRYAADIESSSFTNDLAEIAQISIFPNPTSAILNIDSDISLDRLEVKNVLGQSVLSAKYSSQIDLNEMPGGQYFITFYSKERSQTLGFYKK